MLTPSFGPVVPVSDSGLQNYKNIFPLLKATRFGIMCYIQQPRDECRHYFKQHCLMKILIYIGNRSLSFINV